MASSTTETTEGARHVSSRGGVPPWGLFRVPALGSLSSTRIRTLGIIGLLFLAEVFVFLGTVVNQTTSGDSTLLPGTGNWSAWEWDMVFYIFLTLGAMVLVLYIDPNDVSVVPKRKDISMFLLNYALWSILGWGALTLIYPHGIMGVSLTPTERIQQFVFTSLFVAPTEELMFRVVLPRVLNSWILGSVVAFVIFHFSAYSQEYASGFIPAILSLVILSFVFWFVYDFKLTFKTKHGKEIVIAGGYGSSTGLHAVYDLFVFGVIKALLGGFGIAL